MKRIILASSNLGKLKEFSNYFSSFKIDLVAQSTMGIISPPESGKTFVENAIIKARFASLQSGLPALSDDSGLIVPALNGAPGIFSARYAGHDATDLQNNNKLLKEISGYSEELRRCFFICVLVYMRDSNDSYPIISEGIWEGKIGHSPKGENGFGYDPIFIDLNSEKTAAQLDSNSKLICSHRGQALRRLSEQFAHIIKL